jgi:glycosyltransferase involved in cell wall biosynthesis
MNIIHLSFSDISGGAARAAYRLHNSLRRIGLNSKMQVWSKASGDPSVYGNSSKTGRMATEIRSGIGLLANATMKVANPARHSINLLPSGWVHLLNSSDADIIHLHWLGAETLSIREIAQIRKPIVWTLHDMWAFCGAEHYTDDGLDARWRHGYQSTNRPRDESGFDLNYWTAGRKQRHWQKKPLNLVCPSNWLADCVRSSALMHNWPVSVIPNPLDLDDFRPIEKKLARWLLNLPPNKTLILFGAIGGSDDPRKGSDLLISALNYLNAEQHQDIELVIFGQSRPVQVPELGFPIRYMGHLHDEISLTLLYSAVDVFVAPSRQDNLPNTVVEASACGTPTVAFKIGGMPDLIQHQVSGYLAQPNNIDDLATGIKWVLDQQADNNSLGNAARQYAEKTFNSDLVARQYLSIYQESLGSQKDFSNH